MKIIRLFLACLVVAFALVAVLVLAAIAPAAQTWFARMELNSRPGTKGSLESLSAGFGEVDVEGLHLETDGAVLTLPESMRRYMLIFSSLSLAALVCFASHKSFGIGAGMMERIAAYPITIWLITFGLYIWRFNPKRSKKYT